MSSEVSKKPSCRHEATILVFVRKKGEDSQRGPGVLKATLFLPLGQVSGELSRVLARRGAEAPHAASQDDQDQEHRQPAGEPEGPERGHRHTQGPEPPARSQKSGSTDNARGRASDPKDTTTTRTRGREHETPPKTREARKPPGQTSHSAAKQDRRTNHRTNPRSRTNPTTAPGSRARTRRRRKAEPNRGRRRASDRSRSHRTHGKPRTNRNVRRRGQKTQKKTGQREGKKPPTSRRTKSHEAPPKTESARAEPAPNDSASPEQHERREKTRPPGPAPDEDRPGGRPERAALRPSERPEGRAAGAGLRDRGAGP